jgi:hypothetical protein
MTDSKPVFFVVGNGPSLQTKILDALPEGRWIGMNAAYKYWDKTGHYPHYYSCLDPVVVLQHADAIVRMMSEGKIAEFFLHEEILKAHPDLEDHPKVTLSATFMEQEGVVPISSLSRYKQTTGVLATRFCIERGHHNLCLLGIDCNYVEQLCEAEAGKAYELVINKDIVRNPNYFFDNYQEKNEKYQVPNPQVHSGNLHLQSFMALRDDLARSAVTVSVTVGARESLLCKLGVFAYSDVARALGQRRLGALAVPLTPGELDGFLDRLDLWIDPKLQPSLSPVSGVALHVFLSCGERDDLKGKIEAAVSRLPWLSRYFSDIQLTFLDIPAEVDYYVKGTSLNIFCNKSGPNIFFLMIMAACRDYQKTFLMEADCIPVRPGWLDALEHAATDCPLGTWVIGANYSGPTLIAPSNSFHINGNAIYSTGDREFQEFLSSDFVTVLQWLVARVSNNVAYDVALAQAMNNYVELLNETGIDIRKYINRYVFTSVIYNISGKLEVDDPSLFNLVKHIRNNSSTFFVHSGPAIAKLLGNFDKLDSVYLGDAGAVREIRVHSLAPTSKALTWKALGYGVVQGVVHSKGDGPIEGAGLAVSVDVRRAKNDVLVLKCSIPDGVQLAGIEVIGITDAHKRVVLSEELKQESSTITCKLSESELSGNACIEVSFIMTFTVAGGLRTFDLTDVRVTALPASGTQRSLHVFEKDTATKQTERAWKQWIVEGQDEFNKKYGFITAFSKDAVPIIREVLSGKSAHYDEGGMSFDLSDRSATRFRFGATPENILSGKVSIAVTLVCSADCTVECSAKAFGFGAVDQSKQMTAGHPETVRLDFSIDPTEGVDFFLTIKGHSTQTLEDGPVRLRIREIHVLNSSQSGLEGLTGASPSGIISINPDAESFFGHFLNYEARLGKALSGRKLSHAIVGPVDARPDVYEAHPEMERVFSGRSNALYAKRLGEVIAGLAAFEHELDAYLGTLPPQEPKLLFMYCGSLEVGEVFKKLATKYPSCTFAISLYYLSWQDLKSPDFIAYWRPRLRELADHPRIRLIVPSPELAEELSANFDVAPSILPHPTTTFHDAELGALVAGRTSNDDEGLTVVFPGNLRGGKGYDLTFEAILDLINSIDDTVRLRVRFPPDDSVNKARRAFFDSIRDRVEIVDSYLDEQAFRDLLLSADLVALPYTPDRFKNRTSGLLIDSLMLGIPCVVIENTWLARTVSEYGFGLASAEDGVDFAAKIRSALERVDAFKRAAITGRDEYMRSNSWDALVGFLVASHKRDASNVNALAVSRPAAPRLSQPQPTGIIKGKKLKTKRLLIIGNGPSARILAEAGLHNIPADMDSWGTTAAFRYFEKIGWWPTYYALADRKVVYHHRETFARLLEDPKVATKRFFLSWKVSDSEKMELIPHSSTGSFSLKKAIELGYTEIYLIGMEGAYVEEILESRSLSEQEIEERGFGVLNLSRAESKLRVIEHTPTYNPNYFFSGYQQHGDVYSLPQAHTHQANWDSVKSVAREAGAKVINLSRISKIDAFEFGDVRDVFDFVPADCWDEIPDPFSENAQHVKSHFTVVAGPGFTNTSKESWHYAPVQGRSGYLRAIFSNVGITAGRSLVGGVRLTADRPAKVVVALGRHGSAAYEGSARVVELEAGVPTVVDVSVRFRKSHKQIKLQISHIDLGEADSLGLLVENMFLTEMVNSVTGRHDGNELTRRRADRAFQEREDSFALATYICLETTTESGLHRDRITQISQRIGIPDCTNFAGLALRLGVPEHVVSGLNSPGQADKPTFLGLLAQRAMRDETPVEDLRLLLRSCASALLLEPDSALQRMKPGTKLGTAIETALSKLADGDELRLHFKNVEQSAYQLVSPKAALTSAAN